MNILVIRFSAMGDVALMAPVLVAVAANHPNVQLTVVTRGNFAPFFYNIPNVNIEGINLKKFKGIFGLVKLYQHLKKLGPYDKIVDLHGSLRSKLLSLLFKFDKIPSFTIIKGRKEKLRQIRQDKKKLEKLPHTVERYLSVFEKAGLPSSLRKGPWINVDGESKIYAKDYFKSIGLDKKSGLWVGLAPFAGHVLKEWPFAKCQKLLEILPQEFSDLKIFLFGSKEELPRLELLRNGNPNIHLAIGGHLGIRGELGILEKLDVLIGMDSSNVHIAALLKRPVISLFGTTHPFSGFAPFGQEDTGVLQVDLPCRPCSIYGNTKCFRKDFACMEMIEPQDVIRRLKLILNVNTLW
jgi:ADP-heptose:LPS heptosyltransferase